MDAYAGFPPGPYARKPVVYLRKPIPDHGLPRSADQMQEILDEIEAALAEGRRIYLHCRTGIGRTNLVAGCWYASAGAGANRGGTSPMVMPPPWRSRRRCEHSRVART